MKKFKLVITTCIFILAILFIGTTQVHAESDLFLDNLNFEAHINTDGSMDVTETWKIDISDTNTIYKTFKINTSKYSGISDVEVTDITNERNTKLTKSDIWKYHMEKNTYFGGINEDGLFEIAWGVGLESNSAQKQYKISYKVEDVISKHSDYAQLYWQFVGEDFEISSKEVTGTIYLPQKTTSKEEIKVWGHTEDLNGEIYVTDLNKINFEINNFASGRYIEVRTLFPTQMIHSTSRTDNKTILSQVIEEETQWANEANRRRELRKNVKIAITIIVNIIAFIITIVFIKSIIKNYKKSKTLVKIKPEQEFKYFREMPRENATPAQVLAIYDKKLGAFSATDIGKIFSATLLNLNLKKLIEFSIEDKNNISIILKDNIEISEQLPEDEKVIYEFIKKAITKTNKETLRITIKELEKYIKESESKVVSLKSSIEKKTEKSLYNEKLADKTQYKEYEKYIGKVILYSSGLFIMIFAIICIIATLNVNALICMIPLIIVIIIDITITSKLISKINVLTQQGVNEQNKWKALKNYMNDFSMLDKREVPEIVIWEKFLVYATAFGIADKVLKQLKVVYPNIDELVDVNTHTYMHLMMHTNFSKSFSNSINNSISSAYSSATGGGGGFSGGGRRPEEVGGGGGGR